MNIFYTCDDNFVWLAGISIISVCENNRDLEQINFYLLGDNVSDENRKALENIVHPYNRTFTLINIPKLDVPEELTSTRWPRSAYTRLFAGQLLPYVVKRALYLDCDTIVCGSLKKLESLKLRHTVAGVRDCISGMYKQNIGLDKNDVYINAGVILIDVDKMRGMNMKQKISDFFKAYKETMFFADQDVLNGIFKGKVGVLKPHYDVMSIIYNFTYKQLQWLRRPTAYYDEEEYNEAKAHPIIVHFTTNMLQHRPWVKGSTHPRAKDFDYYQSLSPWKDIIKQEPKSYNRDQKIMAIVLKMPNFIALPILGLIHSVIRPLYIVIGNKCKIISGGGKS